MDAPSESDRADRTGFPPRPLPPRPAGERIAAWMAWFGTGRLVLTAACVVVVAAGAYWLVRAPSPATEVALPMAASGTVPGVTLPTPTASPPTTTPPDAIEPVAVVIVHVAGAVRSPGVYRLTGTPRVHEAIQRAGGPAPDADLDALNLAQPIHDGQRLYVPVLGDVTPGSVVPLSPPGTDPPADGDPGPAPGTPVDLNRATVAELEALPGVGPSTAQAIVDDRDRHGPFAAIDELDRVPGIGPAKLAALRDLVVV